MIKFLKKSNEDKIKKFYDEAYGKEYILGNPIHQKWQFKINPFNKSQNTTIIFSEHNNEISSHLGFIPVELLIGNKIKSAIWHVSFFTLERFRGQKLGTELIKYNLNSFDFAMVLNGSDGTKKVYENISGHDLGNLNHYIVILNKKNLEIYFDQELSQNEASLNCEKLYFSRIKNLKSDYSYFWKKVSKRYTITVNRNENYLSWRYLEHPLIDYHFLELRDNEELVGYCVLRFEDNNKEIKAARIIDLIVFENYEFQIFQHIIQYCKNKVDFLDFFFTGNYYTSSLKKSNFFNNAIENLPFPTVFNPLDKHRQSKINFFYRCNIENEIGFNLKNINNWYIVKGDSDQDRPNKL